jgi:hypothetical protein
MMRPITQCALACVVAAVSWIILPNPKQADQFYVTDYTGLYGIFGILSAVLALAGSFCIGHALQFSYSAAAERSQAYSMLLSRLDALDDYLRSQDPKDPIVDSAREFIWEINKLRLDDFPLINQDREKLLGKVLRVMKQREKRGCGHLWYDVARALHRCEEAMNDLGLISIRQVVAQCILNPVVKMFFYLSLLLIVVAALLVVPKVPLLVAVSVASFFTAMTIQLLGEVVWAIHSDFDERLTFVEREEDPDEDDEST